MSMVAVARGASRSIVFSAVRGAGLIGLAVIVGIVLLQVVDDGSSGPSNGGGDGGGTPATTPGETAAPTTAAGRNPAEVRVLVLNAGQAAGSAGNKANQLRAAGYNILPASNTLPRTGIAVQCREGFDSDAAILAAATDPSATVEPFPDEPPPEAADADCLVLLGQI
jgi:LytR cell envelope-related transcriptional attenuator